MRYSSENTIMSIGAFTPSTARHHGTAPRQPEKSFPSKSYDAVSTATVPCHLSDTAFFAGFVNRSESHSWSTAHGIYDFWPIRVQRYYVIIHDFGERARVLFIPDLAAIERWLSMGIYVLLKLKFFACISTEFWFTCTSDICQQDRKLVRTNSWNIVFILIV